MNKTLVWVLLTIFVFVPAVLYIATLAYASKQSNKMAASGPINIDFEEGTETPQ